MTRRSFCFLFGAGLAATALGIRPSELSYTSVDLSTNAGRFVHVSEELLRDCTIDIESLFHRLHFNVWAESA